jgi:hypothetical protein
MNAIYRHNTSPPPLRPDFSGAARAHRRDFAGWLQPAAGRDMLGTRDNGGLKPTLNARMATEAQINEWRKYHRQSVKALPYAVGFTVVLRGVLSGLSFWLPIPNWLTWILVGSCVLSVLTDAINIVYLREKLRAAARSP